ncbi:MAG: SMP-30/gluconolactonase/LRE family protein [Candidatus Halalkalibacterium sp. M3_1C_030]
MIRLSANLFLLSILVLLFSCSGNESNQKEGASVIKNVQDSTDITMSIEGLDGPEAVRYDPDQDVYFISNFTGGGTDRDMDGFITKALPDGTIDSLRFMVGTEENPLHAPRGMYITGDTLWAADIDGVHGFNRITSEQIAFIDFTSFEPGFLNDIVEGTDGNLYVTDTGKSAVYRIEGATPSVYKDSLAAAPNGITLNPETGNLVLAPWGGATVFPAFSTGDSDAEVLAEAQSGGNFDGIEFVDGRLLAASQMDSSLHELQQGMDQIIIQTPGRPADIGIDTKRNLVLVPYIALNRVDVWQLAGTDNDN